MNMRKAVDFIKRRFVYAINDNNLEKIFLKTLKDSYQVIIILGDDYYQKKTELTNIKIKFEHIFSDADDLTPKVYQHTNHFDPDYTCTQIWDRRAGYLVR